MANGNAKKLKSGNVFVRGVVIYDNHEKATVNSYTQQQEYTVGVLIKSQDAKSIVNLKNFIKALELTQEQVNRIFNIDSDGNVTIFAKNKNVIQVIDKEMNIVENANLVACDVIIALNVTFWQVGNVVNVGKYCNGIQLIQQVDKANSIFDMFNSEQVKNLQSDAVQLENTAVTEIGNLNDYEMIISDGDIPF